MIKKILALFIIITALAGKLTSQVGSFSGEPEKYAAELRNFMGSELSGTQLQIMNQFTAAWDSGLIDNRNKLDIITLSGYLVRKNARPKPHFINFISNLVAFQQGAVDTMSYKAWKKGLESLAGDNRTQITIIDDFMSVTYNLLSDGILYQTQNTLWKAENPLFTMDFRDSLIIIFKPTTLTCYALRDSMRIYETEGIMVPLTHNWLGKKGIVTWERSGYNREVVYAELGNYHINLRFSNYKADTVNFINKNYFDFIMVGRLEDKVEFVQSKESVNYPRFESYQDNYRINNIFPNVNYQGGLSMHGSKLIGSGTKFSKARLYFIRNDSIKLTARSEYFAFQPGRVNGVGAHITIPIGVDSIYHPYLGLDYLEADHTISLFRTDDFRSQSPYFNNYHRVEMNFEQLRWNLNENRILFKMREGAASSLANFQSDNLFDANLYMRIQGVDDVNPIVLLRKFSEESFSINFKGADFARFMRAQHSQVQQILKRLAVLGFILYDLEDDMVTTRQKLYDWVYASVDYIDYDVITLFSETEAPLENASLNLSTYDLTINGIPQIRLSNAQAVAIYPDDAKIVLKKDRSFQFDGVIDAGLFRFFGHKFFFNYEEFKLELQDVDSISLRVESGELDAIGRNTLLNIKSIIQEVTGELLIDKSDNKSGRKNYSQYPVFKSLEDSYVFYDDPKIQGGVYKKDNFFFEIYPFTFDSLDNFSKSGLRLKGKFVSADIFPDIEQTLLVQADNSLGFKHTTTPSGLPLYGGRGQYYQYFEMSNNGLKGSGTFDYLTATGKSDNIMFHPDSMFAILSDFTIDRQSTGVQFPAVKSRQNRIVFYPYQDQLLVSKGTGPFSILNDSTYLDGNLALSSTGLTGSGRMDLTNSVLLSNHFTYGARMFDADTANFRLKSVNTDGFTLMTDNINAHVDFESRSGIFKTNEEFSLVEFPENKYVSHLDLFVWNMDKTELEMRSKAGAEGPPEVITAGNGEEELIGPRYISVDPLLDSLSFVSTRAVYDYKRNIIKASYVTFLKVADAYIYPKEGRLEVNPYGKINHLEDAQIMANRLTKMHLIYSAAVDVQSRKKYSGTGYSDYVDETGEKQAIFFDKIRIDDSGQTTASGMIAETQEFTLSPVYGFQGMASLFADQQFLVFNGGVKPFHDCEKIETAYLKFETSINPEDIYIPVPEDPLDINMNTIFDGIMITRDSAHIYPTFFSKRKLSSDRYVSTAAGFLYYDKETEEYRVSTKEKLANLSLSGNYLKLSRNTCYEYGEGRIDLGINLGQARLRSIGFAEHNTVEVNTDLEVMIMMDFFMSDDAFQVMANDVDSMPGLEAFDLSDARYLKTLSEVIGSDRAERMQADLGLYGAYQTIPDELKHTLLFTRVKLKWNQDTRSYRSEGKIALGSINGRQIHKYIEGYMELSKRRSGDLFDLYFQLDNRTWYYFGYTRGVLHVLSSSRDFNTTVSDLKTNQRKLKTSRNEIPYIFVVTTANKKEMFLRRFQEPTQDQIVE